jgi:ABC-type phosphate transport system substrate-binding protein
MESNMSIKKTIRPLIRPLLACLLSVLAVNACAGDIVVIVSAKNSLASLQAEQVTDIFLGQVGQFPDGRKAIALDQDIDSAARDAFYNKVVAKSPALVRAYWARMIFTGRGRPPREVEDSLAMRKRVAENPNLIGYIDRSALDATVKIVLLVP